MNLKQSLVCVTLLSLSLPARGADSSLVGWWRLDEASGTVAADSSGKGNQGQVKGTGKWVPGFANRGLEFNGTDTYVDCGSGASLNLSGSITVSLWIKTGFTGGDRKVASNQDGSRGGYKLSVYNSLAEFEIRTSSNTPTLNRYVPGGTILQPGTWYHVVGVYSKGYYIRTYVNENLDRELITGEVLAGSNGTFELGREPFSAGYFFLGTMDDVRVYNRALDSTEIKAIAAPLTAYRPNPADGAAGVGSTTLSWTAGGTAKQHDVYFGTSTNPPLVKRQTGTIYIAPAFTVGKKYYWRIDEVEADGKTIYRGTVWSFTAASPLAFDPIPVSGAENVNVFPDGLLSWLAGTGATKHHLYLGTDSAAVTARATATDKGLLTKTYFSAGMLRSGTTYYWVVDEVQSNGTVKQGTLWSFTTETGVAHKVLREWWTGISGGTVADLTVDPRFPDEPTGSEWLDDFEGPINWGDNYGSRLRGWLVAPKSGAYRFWIASDDSSELWLSSSADPAKATKIAGLNGATGRRDWTAQPGQKSAAITLTAGQKYYIEALMKEGGGDDHVSVAWQPPGETQKVVPGEFVDGFALAPLQAWNPDPENGATGIAQNPTLSWSVGEKAMQHRIYFGEDKAAVTAADLSTAGLYKGEQSSTTFQPGWLAWGQTYYWRIDEVNSVDSQSPRKGNVWSFTTLDFLPVDDFESYDNSNNGPIWTVWKDGGTNGTGSHVGYNDPVSNLLGDSVETAIVHGGRQSMPFAYDNVVAPCYSEATRPWFSGQNWTSNGVNTLSLWFRARFVKFLENPAGTITMSAGGKDIWDTSDEFRFAYKRLSGNGTIVAKVEELANPSGYTDGWAKAGVMIRESLNPGAKFVDAVLTPGNGASFQWRSATSGNCQSSGGWGVVAPHWVKLSRTSNTITAQHSSDGVTWQNFDSPTSVTLSMTGSIYIGLALTSRYSWDAVTAKLSHVATTGSVTGSWTVADIGINHPGNQPDPLYVTLQDAWGATATVNHPDNPKAVLKTDWTQWKIPLSNFVGVDPSAITRLTLGVGDRTNPTPTSDGELFIDDIRVLK